MSLNQHLPAWIRQTFDPLLEGVSRKVLAEHAEAISLRYRAGGGSQLIRNEADALAYALTRMPATYAAVRASLRATAERMPEFKPQTMLDLGAGPGTATWAAMDAWESIHTATLLDQNNALLKLAGTIGAATTLAVTVTAGTLPAALDKLGAADLVVASYALTELPQGSLSAALEQIWSRVTDTLVVVEPGTPEGFRRILAVRAWLKARGATIAAPCTHAEACPLDGGERWCHFNQRLPRTRDHLLVKSASVNFEDERYAYLVATKTAIAATTHRRVLATPSISKAAINVQFCAPRAVEWRRIAHRDKADYGAARRWDWGDLVEIKASEE